MSTKILSNKILILSLGFGVLLAVVAFASSKDDIIYPISELGNCQSEDACRGYCENPQNIEQCVVFAEAHNLIPREEIERGKKFVEVIKRGGGPGGCKSEGECEAYCGDVGRIDECLKFAEDEGFLSAQELEEAKKIKAAIDAGKKLPGGCRNKAACEAYCQSPENIDECFAFARESGFISEEELREAEKFIPLMKEGKLPGGCRSKETCEAYCESEEHFDECLAFAEQNGLISEKELDIMRKTGGKGPGGCKGRACQAFCENPSNHEACFEFAKEHGLINEAELERMEEGLRFMRESLENADPKVKECVESIIGAPGLSGLEPGKNLAFSGPEIGEKMRECFEAILPQELRGQFKFEGTEVTGPGGCKSQEECEAFCRSNPEACGIQIPQDSGSGEFHPPEVFRPPEGFQGPPEGFKLPESSESFQPPTDFKPPEGTVSPEQFQQEYEQQYQQQYKQQYQQQYQTPLLINLLGTLVAPFFEILR